MSTAWQTTTDNFEKADFRDPSDTKVASAVQGLAGL